MFIIHTFVLALPGTAICLWELRLKEGKVDRDFLDLQDAE